MLRLETEGYRPPSHPLPLFRNDQISSRRTQFADDYQSGKFLILSPPNPSTNHTNSIFFPTHYDLTSPALLPTLFTLHGGGFTVGYASDDDKWNRTFADTYTILVIALNYSKAPWAAFPVHRGR